QIGFLVRGAVRILHERWRTEENLATRAEVAPVVVAELRVIGVARRVPADRAGVVDDLVAVHPHLQQAARVERVAELEDERRPLAELDRDLGVLVAVLAAARIGPGTEHLERATARRPAVRGERERGAIA